MTYKPFSVITVPFPFTDKEFAKKRPALVISSVTHQEQTNHISLLMITSAKNSAWMSDYSINALVETGLSAPSIVRQKIFTIDLRLVIKNIGKLSLLDKKGVLKKLYKHIGNLDEAAF